MENGCEYLKELEEVTKIIDNMLLKLVIFDELADKITNEAVINEREGASD